MRLLTVDPGQTTGWALFISNALIGAGATTKFELLDRVIVVDRVVIEKPAWYGSDNKVDVNDLIELAVFVGEVKRKFHPQPVDTVLPVTWKGTVPKKIHNQRVLNALTTEERELLPKRPRAGDHDHNMLDAVGLGLWHLRRL